MQSFSLIVGSGGPWGNALWRRLRTTASRQGIKTSASSGSAGAPNARGSYFDRVKGWQGPWKAALTSGTLSAAGDLLAQTLVNQMSNDGQQARYDPMRTLRMFGFGLFMYGPLQFYWYNLLEHLMPLKNTANFLTKVTSNQLILGPITLSSVFSWNLALQGNAHGIPEKIQNDLLPTMLNGWKFWVPAASINFYLIPVEQQVLYMSACGILWTAYLSYASATSTQAVAATSAPQQPSAASEKRPAKSKK